MKPLLQKLRKNGFDYTQLLRGEKSAVYQQRVSESMQYYEVFLLKIKPERKLKGKTIEAKEWFPPNEASGKWGWTFRSYEDAKWRFDELEEGKTRLEFTHRNTTKKKYHD